VMDGNKVDGPCFLQRSTVTYLADVSHSTNIRLLLMLVKQIEEEERFMSHVPYSNVFGSIMCVMVRIHRNVSHAFSVVSTDKVYWPVVKLILRCLQDAMDVGSIFDRDTGIDFSVIRYVDSDYAGDLVVTRGDIRLKKIVI
jgi:hypothetical protein